MHDAYTITSCLKRNLIESIAGYGNKLIIGTKTGQLFMYCIPGADSIHQTNLYTYFETADKKPICQMKLVPEENLLFVLTNGVINVFYIGGLHFVLTHSCLETKGCSTFAADVKITRSQSGETDHMISLCVSIKRVLHFFVWKSKREKLEHLAKQIPMKDDPKALCLMDNIICIGFKEEYVAYNLLSKIPEKHDLIVTSSTNRKSPCICLIQNSMIGITKDDYLIFMDPRNLTKKKELLDPQKLKPIKWGSSVLDLVWDEPYIFGLTANGLEIHVLDDFGPLNYTLVQTIPNLNKVKSLVRSDHGGIFAASESEVWYLRLVDIEVQRETLLRQSRFKLAIELTKLSNEPEESKINIVSEIRVLYARDLFVNKKYTAAFKEFLQAQANPYDVILLFPVSIKGESFTESSIHPNMPDLKDEDLKDATLALIDYLIVVRQTKIYSKTKIVSIMDNTLLRCYLQTNDSLIAPLIRRKQCDFLESEKTLQKHNKINELIILYQVFEKHAKALALLKDQASVEGSSLFGYERTVRYLQDLDKDYKDLVFEYSKWILDKNPEEALPIFTNTYFEPENNNSISKSDVLDFLAKTCQILVLPYLEHIVNILNDPSPIFHEDLIRAYVEKIKKLNQKCNPLHKRKLSEIELEELKSYRLKLFEILEKSDKYSPERVLQFFPTDDFFTERLLVLEKMNDHEKILVIYIQILGNVEKALEYCEKVHDNIIFDILLQILLNPLKTSPYKGVQLHSDFLEPNIEIVIQLLNEYPTKMNLPRVFSLLPGDIPVHRLKNYMEVVTRMSMKKKWDCAIGKEILTTELLHLNDQISLHRQRNCVSLTESSICKECRKYFNNEQVLVRKINGDVVHLACFKKNIDNDAILF